MRPFCVLKLTPDGSTVLLREGVIVDGKVVNDYPSGRYLPFKMHYSVKGRYHYYSFPLTRDDIEYMNTTLFSRYTISNVKRAFDTLRIRFADSTSARRMGFKTLDDLMSEPTLTEADVTCAVTPYRHQLLGASYIISQKQAFLNWETGTGKTLAALLAFDYLRRNGKTKKLLVVCPNTLVENWAQKMREYYPDWDAPIILTRYDVPTRIAKMYEAVAQDAPVMMITNYDTFSRMRDGIRPSKPFVFDMIIYDESHFLRNSSARTINIMRSLRSEYAVLLTGTPTDGRFEDYFYQFRKIEHAKPFYVKTRNDFTRTYTEVDYYRHGLAVYRYVNVFHLMRYVNHHTFELRKEQCVDLPEKVYNKITLSLHPEHRQFYEKFVKSLTVTKPDGEDYITNILKLFLYARMIVSGSLHEGANVKKDWLLDNLYENEKYVIFAVFRDTIWKLYDTLRREGYKVATLYGDTPEQKRMELVRDFNSTDELNILIVQPQVGGQGIDLIGSHICIFYDNDFSYVVRKQAEDRLHRVGQKRKVEIIDLVARDTIDEHLYRTIQRKQDFVEAIRATDDFRKLLGGNEG